MSAEKVAKALQMLLTLDQVAAMTQLSRRQIQRMVAERSFSEVVYVTETDVRIPAASYAEWLANRTVRRMTA
jgi:predicted DNA-binding transcriptional regulator AlpA